MEKMFGFIKDLENLIIINKFRIVIVQLAIKKQILQPILDTRILIFNFMVDYIQAVKV
jgi:hypothetical protein